VTAVNLTVKKWLCIGAGFGAGAVLMVALLLGGITWYSSRPKPWNKTAIKATYDAVNLEDDDRHLEFYYVLENATESDYTLQESSTAPITGRLKKEKSLTPPMGMEIQITYPVFIPAKQRARYRISLPSYKYPGGWLKDNPTEEERDGYEKEISAYVGQKLGNLDGFVLFDETNRYEIDFPKGW